MPGTRNTYIEGLDRDTSYEKFSNKKYYNAENFRVTTKEGLSTGSIEVEDGNALKFKIPVVPESKFINDSFIPDGGDNNATVYINGHTETGISFSNLNELKERIEDRFSSEVDSGDFKIIVEGNRLYLIGLDARDIYTGSGTPSDNIAFYVGDSSMDPPNTGPNTSVWGGNTFSYYPPQEDLKILGWTTLRDKIIVFTTNSEEKEPDSYGQIWMLEYDPDTNRIKGIDNNNFLLPSETLVVNNKADLSLYHRIRKAIGRYENNNIGRVYFTDNYNPPRSINVFDLNSYILPASDMNINQDVDFSQPIIEDIGSGDLSVGSVVQFSYRLRGEAEGSETIFAPLSRPIKLSQYDPNTDSYQDYGGSPKDEADNKSVTYRIPHIDPNYDVIEHIIVIYEDPEFPRIYKFSEEFTGSSQTLQVTSSEIPNDAVEISGQEFNSISNFINRTKSMDVKDNHLVLADNKTLPFDVDLDTRAYRFNSSRMARVYDKSQVPNPLSSPDHTIDGTSPNWNVSDDSDAINPYNYDDLLWDYTLNDIHEFQETVEYKYKADGSTLGGEGENISYEFVTRDLNADDDDLDIVARSNAPFITVGKENINYSYGIINRSGNNITYTSEDHFNSHKSPIIESLFTGYARGEVYRFGIVFYNRAGSPSFVNWIGDIRFPFAHEIPLAEGEQPTSSSNRGSAGINKTLGIKFNVDVSSIQEEISGFSIVRVERTDSDKSRIETGTTSPLLYGDIVGTDLLMLDGGAGTGSPDFDSTTAAWKKECIYTGALGHFSELDSLAEDIDYGEFVLGYKDGNNDVIADTPNSTTYLHKYYPADESLSRILSLPSRTAYRIDINNARVFDPGEEVENLSGFQYSVSNRTWKEFWDGNPTSLPSNPDGWGDRKLILSYERSPDNGNLWTDTDRSNLHHYPIIYVTLGRKRDKAFAQYGGDGYEDRSNQPYIIAGDFQPVTSSHDSFQYEFEVFGGDTYNYYYDEQLFARNVDNSGSSNKAGLSVCHTLETPLNIGLRDKGDSTFNNFAKEGWASASSTSDILSNTDYNNVYTQENKGRQLERTEDVFSNTVEEHSHQIRASAKKIDGELVDSWRIFPPSQTIEVEGTRGPINEIINFKDKVYFLQDRGFGAVSINERATIQSDQGTELVLGYGGVLDDYRYISTQTGCIHQSSVTDSGSAIFYFDALNKKLMRFGHNGNMPLSDIKGLSSLFGREIEGRIENTDQTIIEEIEDPTGITDKQPIGIHSVYDKRHNRVFFTFLKGHFIETTPPATPGNTIPELSFDWKDTSFTLSYSEKLGAFESFYDFIPPLYLGMDHKVFSIDPNNLDSVYEHEEGEKSTYYGTTYPSEIDIIVNERPNIPKIFNNLELNAESYNSSEKDVWDDIIDRIEVYNNYQDSGEVPIVIEDNIQRRFRKWRMEIPRNNDESSITYNSNKNSDQRIRGPWTHVRLIYENEDNNRFMLHDLETYFMEKPY